MIGRDLIYAASVSKMRKMGGSGLHMCGSGGRGFQDAGIAAYSSENAGSRVGRGSKMRLPLIECGLRMRGWGLRVRGSATGPGALGGRGAPLPPRIRSSLRRRKFITVTEKHKFYQFCVFLYQIKQLFTTSMFVFCSWRSPASFSIHSGES